MKAAVYRTRRSANAKVAEKAKTQKKIIGNCLDGANRWTKVEGWLPGRLAFPLRLCSEAGTVGTADTWARVRDLLPAS